MQTWHESKQFVYEIILTFAGGISNSAPSSSNVMLLYSLLADRRLCSITARSRMLDPEGIYHRYHVT